MIIKTCEIRNVKVIQLPLRFAKLKLNICRIVRNTMHTSNGIDVWLKIREYVFKNHNELLQCKPFTMGA